MSESDLQLVIHTGEESAPVLTQEVFIAYLEGERRAYLTRVDNIDRLLGRRPRRVACPNCSYVFDPKRAHHSRDHE